MSKGLGEAQPLEFTMSFLNKVTHSRELHSLLLAMVLLTSLVLWQVSLRTEIKVEYSL